MHWQTPPAAHTGALVGQVPQLPPQPSEPHDFPVQLGTHWQAPLAWQTYCEP